MSNGRARLLDFGLSNIMEEYRAASLMTSTIGGACRWTAPELFPIGVEMESVPSLTKACDIYSFGSVGLQVSQMI